MTWITVSLNSMSKSLESLHSTLKSLEQGAMSQVVTLVESSIKDLLQHQKLVRFADWNSVFSWDHEYL
uniref:Uncharacterized protein n=1 Tax=Romanomermis culicivorax TaxID=13658 RepID=A0A915KTF4_ROMCU